ncbi:MAG: alpha/beta hydrolase [Acidobacteriota bacterium]
MRQETTLSPADEREIAPAAPDENGAHRGSALGKMLFLGLGVAAGAGVALAVYRKPLETALLLKRLKLYALGVRSRESFVAGARVRYWIGGDWSPTAIVLVHGPFEASETWHAILPRVAKSFRVIAPDLPGFGRSNDPVNPSVAHCAKVLGALLTEQGVETAILVGSSLGALVAIETALMQPKLVRGLVLEDVLGFGGVLPERQLLVHGGQADVDEMLRKTFWQPPSIPAFVREEIAIRSQRPSVDLLLSDVEDGGRALATRASEISVPTLLLWGDSDGLAPIEAGESLNALISGSRLVELPCCGHLPHIEDPDAFYGELMDFLAGPAPEIQETYEI